MAYIEPHTVQGWLAAFNLRYTGASDPLAKVYPQILGAHRPPGHVAGGGWDALAEASMRARGILYYRSQPGDCGATPQQTGGGNGQLAQTALGVAGSGAMIGEALTSSLAALGGITAAFTAGVGLVLLPIITIFQHHAQAVAIEKATNCQAMALFNPAITQVDEAVHSGKATGNQGYSAMLQITQTVKNTLTSVARGDNWGTGVQHILDCILEATAYLYGLKPIPGAAPPPKYNTLPAKVTVSPIRPVCNPVTGINRFRLSQPLYETADCGWYSNPLTPGIAPLVRTNTTPASGQVLLADSPGGTILPRSYAPAGNPTISPSIVVVGIAVLIGLLLFGVL